MCVVSCGCLDLVPARGQDGARIPVNAVRVVSRAKALTTSMSGSKSTTARTCICANAVRDEKRCIGAACWEIEACICTLSLPLSANSLLCVLLPYPCHLCTVSAVLRVKISKGYCLGADMHSDGPQCTLWKSVDPCLPAEVGWIHGPHRY